MYGQYSMISLLMFIMLNICRRERHELRLAWLRALTGDRDQEPKLLGVAEGGRSLARRGSAREGRDEREQSAGDRRCSVAAAVGRKSAA